MNSTRPVAQALVVGLLAFGEAAGKDTLDRALKLLGSALDDGNLDPEAKCILSSLLAANEAERIARRG